MGFGGLFTHQTSIYVRVRVQVLLDQSWWVQAESLVFFHRCSYDQQGAFAQSPSKTDGLLGLSRSIVAFPAQLAAQGIVKNVVAHCLAGGNHGGGYLFFGDELVPSWGMTWTPVVRKPYRYSI